MLLFKYCFVDNAFGVQSWSQISEPKSCLSHRVVHGIHGRLRTGGAGGSRKGVVGGIRDVYSGDARSLQEQVKACLSGQTCTSDVVAR